MKLAEYLRTRGMTASEMAERLGFSVSTITRLAKGQRQPDWATMRKIEVETGGEVTPNDFRPEQERAA